MDFFEALGLRYYRDGTVPDDKRLRELYIDRIFDVYIDEEQLLVCDGTTQEIADGLQRRSCSSREFIRRMGTYLTTNACRRTQMKQRKTAAGSVTLPLIRLRAEILSPIVSTGFLLLSVVLAGCTNRGLEQAQEEAAEAKATVERLKFNLEQARKEISTLKAEFGAVRQSRDELEEKIAQLIKERDQAATVARQAQEVINELAVRSSGQAGKTVALQQQITDLRALAEEQQALIEQLQKGVAVEPTAEPPVELPEEVSDEPLPPEPNETP